MEFATPKAELSQWAEFNRGSVRGPPACAGGRAVFHNFLGQLIGLSLASIATADGKPSRLVFRVGKRTYALGY